MSAMAMVRLVVGLGVLAATTGCTGATFRSGVGDRYLEHPPWEAGSSPIPASRGWFDPGYQPGASQPAIFDPGDGPGSAVAALLRDVRLQLADLPAGRPLGTPDFPGAGPAVQFGCDTGPGDECLVPEHGQPVYRLAVGRPAGSWTDAAAARMSEAGVEAALVITLSIGQYLPRQRDVLGRKEIELGRDHVARIPWLTSLEAPVSVLQLTGALMGPDGRAIRIAAEGLLPRRTGLLESSIGLQALITDQEVEQARTARRDDLPGRPLVVDVAVRHLVEALTIR